MRISRETYIKTLRAAGLPTNDEYVNAHIEKTEHNIERAEAAYFKLHGEYPAEIVLPRKQ